MQDSDYNPIMTADFPPPASSPTEGAADAEIKVPFAESEGPK